MYNTDFGEPNHRLLLTIFKELGYYEKVGSWSQAIYAEKTTEKPTVCCSILGIHFQPGKNILQINSARLGDKFI